MPEEKKDQQEDGSTAAERKSENNNEPMIPKTRLDEVIAARDKAQTDLKALQDKQSEDSRKALQEQNRYKELYEAGQVENEKLKTQAGKVETYEKTLQSVLDSQLADIPTELRSLVPDALSTQQKLEWLAKNKATLLKPKAFDISANERGKKKDSAPVELLPEEKQLADMYGMSPEEYKKFATSPTVDPFAKEKPVAEKEEQQ